MTSSAQSNPARRPQGRPTGPAQTRERAGTSAHATDRSPASQGTWAVGLALRVLAAGALAVSAYLHVDLAQGYDVIGEQVTVGDLFLAQAAVAGVAALALLMRPVRLTWTLAALVGFGSLAALVLTVYVPVPAIGPFPRIYEPAWFPEKTASAVAAALAGAAATAGLLLAHHLAHRPQPRSNRSDQ
jgi:peptidoglycan/LPS O-acetylase OafA/YrhL